MSLLGLPLNGRTGQFFHFSIGRQARPPEPFPCESDGVSRPVPMTSVDAFLALVGWPNVDVLLSDIQGGEVEMLEGAVGSIAEHSVVESYSGDGLIVASFRAEDRDIPPVRVSRNHPTNSLFRELEYDLHDAWQEIRRLKEARP